jgi:hypothetical protein
MRLVRAPSFGDSSISLVLWHPIILCVCVCAPRNIVIHKKDKTTGWKTEITATVQAGWMFGKADSWLTDGVRPFFLCRNTPGIARNHWGGRGVGWIKTSTAYKISLPIYIVRWVTYSTKCPVCGTLHDVKENNENAWPCAVLAFFFFLYVVRTLTLKVSFFSWILCRVNTGKKTNTIIKETKRTFAIINHL